MSREAIKGATVQLLNSSGAVSDTTVSSEAGAYVFNADSNTQYRIRVRAELARSDFPSWQIRVTDNTSGNALYVMDGSLLNSGTVDSVRDLHAPSGWTGSSYTQARVAGPFAILDSVYQVVDQLVEAGLSQALPATEVRWSENNRVSNEEDFDNGDLPTSFFSPFLGVMYLLGDVGAFSGDSDEYDRSVVQHEFGHYLEDALSRSDSIGGAHSILDLLDMRVAFSEGFANALTGITSGTASYQDSLTSGGSLSGFSFSLETIVPRVNLGWYSEGSVGYIIQDIADDDSETGDDLDLGLAPILTALTSDEYRESTSATSIYSFLNALKSVTDTNTGLALDALAADHNIFGQGPLGTGGRQTTAVFLLLYPSIQH